MRSGPFPFVLTAALLGGLCAAPPAGAAPLTPLSSAVITSDPLGSPTWDGVRAALFGDAPLVFDDQHVFLSAPRKVEDGWQVPVSFQVKGLGKIRQIILTADLNPAPRVLTFHPTEAEPRLALRIKVDQASVLHGAAQTEDGVWHVAGLQVDAPGGGCTVPSASQSQQLWKTRLNESQGQAWRRADGGDRLRLRILHPMNTGFVVGIPAFFIDHLVVKTAEGRTVAEMETAEPVSENPTLTLDLTPQGHSDKGYRVEWSDVDGNQGSAFIPPARQSLREESAP